MIDTAKLFNETIGDTSFPLPLKYYGKLQSLAGMVYDPAKDSNRDKDLKELSDYVQQLSTFDILIKMVLDEFKPIKTFDFNVPKIISWIKSRIKLDDDNQLIKDK